MRKFLRDTFLNPDDISGWFLIPLVGIFYMISPWYLNVESVSVKVLYVVVVVLFGVMYIPNVKEEK